MPSIRQIAKHAGVSIATVSRVVNGNGSINPELRERVLRAVDHYGYTPSVGRKRFDAVALIYPNSFYISSPYDSACFDGMAAAMRESSYDLTLVDLRRDLSKRESLGQFFARKGICGAIIRCCMEERQLVADLAEESLPLVVLGDHFDNPRLTFAYTESEQASREAVEHLVSLGHERIAFAACHRDDGDYLDRLNAYRDVLDSHGLLNEDLVCRVPPFRRDGAPLLRRLMGLVNRPTAIYIADPLIAAGVINESHQLGVGIPDDLSVIGFDDTDIRNLVFPTMSAVCQNSQLLGESAFKLLVSLIEGDADRVQPTRQSAWLEIHNSTGPPPATVQRIMPSGNRLPLN